MGGPSYTILKAISCLLMGKETKSIPVFWLATEDHDIAEIDKATYLDQKANFKNFHLGFPKDKTFIEDLHLTEKQSLALGELLEFLKLSLPSPQEKSYTKIMTSFLVELFKGTGLVFLEPKLLRPLAIPFFTKEICDSDAIKSVLQKTADNLKALEFEPPLQIEEGTNLFFKDPMNHRIKIRKDGNQFVVGSGAYTENELTKLIEKSPHLFSTNVAARTVLQSLLLPTLAYVAGPSEIAYYYQLGDYFHCHGVAMPWIFPRLSGTIVTPEASTYLRKLDLEPWNQVPMHWKETSIDESDLEELGIPSHALHLLRNLLHPHNKPQERILNWYEFQTKTKKNLIQEFLKNVDWRASGHYYCIMDGMIG